MKNNAHDPTCANGTLPLSRIHVRRRILSRMRVRHRRKKIATSVVRGLPRRSRGAPTIRPRGRIVGTIVVSLRRRSRSGRSCSVVEGKGNGSVFTVVLVPRSARRGPPHNATTRGLSLGDMSIARVLGETAPPKPQCGVETGHSNSMDVHNPTSPTRRLHGTRLRLPPTRRPETT